MANTRNAGNDRQGMRGQDQDNLRTQKSTEQQGQDVSNRSQGIPSQKGSGQTKSGSQKQGDLQKTGNLAGNSSVQSGSSSKRGSDRSRSSSGLRSSTLDSSTQNTTGQQFSDESGREEGSDR